MTDTEIDTRLSAMKKKIEHFRSVITHTRECTDMLNECGMGLLLEVGSIIQSRKDERSRSGTTQQTQQTIGSEIHPTSQYEANPFMFTKYRDQMKAYDIPKSLLEKQPPNQPLDDPNAYNKVYEIPDRYKNMDPIPYLHIPKPIPPKERLKRQLEYFNKYKSKDRQLPTTIPELKQYVQTMGEKKLYDMYDNSFDGGDDGFFLEGILKVLAQVDEKPPSISRRDEELFTSKRDEDTHLEPI